MEITERDVSEIVESIALNLARIGISDLHEEVMAKVFPQDSLHR